MYKYHKIKPPYIRADKGELQIGFFENDSIEILADGLWIATEKVDGTNIGIYWDGYDIYIQGRTEKSIIPKPLLKTLEDKFLSENIKNVFESRFGEKEVVLYGEGYGEGIQGNPYKRCGTDFIAFDLYYPKTNTYEKSNILFTFTQMIGVKTVPTIMESSLYDIIKLVKSKPKSVVSEFDNTLMEGVVATPLGDFRDRKGNRIITKIKVCDFCKEDK